MFAQGTNALTVDGRPTLAHIDFALMDSYRFPDRQGFPDSYRAFIRHAGWARTFGLWLIYPPVLPGFADGWQGRARNLTAHLHSVYREGQDDEFDWMIEPDGDWSLPDSLQVFGWSENGDALLWDTASRDTDGEFRFGNHARSTLSTASAGASTKHYRPFAPGLWACSDLAPPTSSHSSPPNSDARPNYR